MIADEPQVVPYLPQTPAGIYEHWCTHPGCTRWGSFGFSSGRAEPRWYCGEHRALGETVPMQLANG